VRRLEVVVEVAVERRRPREAPAHPLLVRLQLRERSRDTAQSVRSRLARWTTKPSKPSAIDEQDGHPAVYSGGPCPDNT
jgi:hypothetical protein